MTRPDDISERARRWLVAMLVLVTLARLAYLAWGCPYALIEDEAHYWEWSRRPALSYYSKGPGVAWTILATTTLAGTSEWGVRLAAPLFSALGAWCVARLTRSALGSDRAALLAGAGWLLAPAFQAMGLLLTIDGPYLACWALGAWAGWEAMARGRRWAWWALGAALGVGFLYKYTMLLAIPGLAAFAWWARGRGAGGGERAWPRWGAVVAGAMLALGVLPVVVWNARESWPTVSHLLGHLGVKGGDVPVTQGAGGWRYSPLWTLELIGTQLAMVGPVLVMGGAEAVRVLRGKVWDGPREAGMYLALMSVPILMFYLLVSFVTAPEGNWPLAGAITLIPLAARRFAGREGSAGARALWRATLALGLGVAVVASRLDLVARLPGVGRLVPVHRLTGAVAVGAHTGRLAREVQRETGREPFFVAAHYGRASTLAFYVPGRPVVYCASTLTGGRRTQYDHWEDTDVRRDHGLIGRPAIIVGGELADWTSRFERVREVGNLEGDPPHKHRPAYVGEGFLGFTIPEGAR